MKFVSFVLNVYSTCHIFNLTVKKYNTFKIQITSKIPEYRQRFAANNIFMFGVLDILDGFVLISNNIKTLNESKIFFIEKESLKKCNYKVETHYFTKSLGTDSILYYSTPRMIMNFITKNELNVLALPDNSSFFINTNFDILIEKLLSDRLNYVKKINNFLEIRQNHPCYEYMVFFRRHLNFKIGFLRGLMNILIHPINLSMDLIKDFFATEIKNFVLNNELHFFNELNIKNAEHIEKHNILLSIIIMDILNLIIEENPKILVEFFHTTKRLKGISTTLLKINIEDIKDFDIKNVIVTTNHNQIINVKNYCIVEVTLYLFFNDEELMKKQTIYLQIQIRDGKNIFEKRIIYVNSLN